MDRNSTASVYLAFANHSKKKKGVQHLKSLYDSLAPILQVSEQDQSVRLLREDKEGIPYAYELLQGGISLPGLTLLHLEADTIQSNEWLLNAPAGKRLSIDWDSLFLDHLDDLKLIYLDKGASLDVVEKLLFAGAPAVIGTHFESQDREAEIFRSKFYAALSTGKNLKDSYEYAAGMVSRTCTLKKIPSDPYEYWASKEEESDATFHWGLYYLSANETILDWQMIRTAAARSNAPIIPPPPPVEKPVLQSDTDLQSNKPSLIEEQANLPTENHTISTPPKERFGNPVFAKDSTEKMGNDHQSNDYSLQQSPKNIPALGLKVKSQEIEMEGVFPPLREIRVLETQIIYQQSEAYLSSTPRPSHGAVAETGLIHTPIIEEPQVSPPVREEEKPEPPEPKREIEPVLKTETFPAPTAEPVPVAEPEKEMNYPSVVEEQVPVQKNEWTEPYTSPIIEYKEESRRPNSLDSYRNHARQTVKEPVKKKSTHSSMKNSKPLIFVGVGLAIVGLALAGMLIFTNQDLGEIWSSDQDSYLSAFGSGDTYNILLLPFREYPNCIADDAFDEIAVRDRMNLFQESEDLGVKVKFLGDGSCPKNSEEARRIGQVYNADLVVWGNYPEIKQDSIDIHTRYISLRNNNNVFGSQAKNLGKLALGDNYDLQEGYIAGGIDDIVNWLLGIISLRNENYISSLQFFEQMNLEESHESANLYHLMAKCYQGLEQYDQVLQAYNQVIFLSPNSANAYHNRGLLYQHLKQEDQAVADFSEAIRLNPRHIKAHYNRNLLMEGEVDDAFYVDPELMQTSEEDWEMVEDEGTDTFPDEEIQLATDTDRSGGDISEAVIEAALIEAEPGEIEDLYEGSSSHNMTSAETFFSDGMGLEQRGLLSEAIEAYSHAIEASPKESSYYHVRAKAYEKTGKLKNALNDYTTASQLSPRNTEIYLNRAYLYERMHKYYEAIADYGKITNLLPKSPGAYLYRGKAYQFVKQPRKSLADFEKAISLNPNDATGYYFRARLYIELKKPNLSIDDFTHAIEINPGYASAYRERGELYVGRKQYEKAIEDFDKVLSLNPRDSNMYARRAEMHKLLGNDKAAIADLGEAVRISPGNKRFKDMLARYSR